MTIDKQTAKFIARIAENLPADMGDDTMRGWIDNPKGLQKFLLGLNPPIATPAPEPPLDFIIRVDRSVRPAYLDGIKEVMHPELESSGPVEYDLQTGVEEWLHDDQKNGRVTGQVIYDHLQASGELALHIGLADLLAIQRKGIAVFRALYAGKMIVGWKSAVRYRFGFLRVPCLYEYDGEVFLDWGWLDRDFDVSSPALRFRK